MIMGVLLKILKTPRRKYLTNSMKSFKLLALSFVFACFLCLPAFAAPLPGSGVITDSASVSAWESYYFSHGVTDGSVIADVIWAARNTDMAKHGYGLVESMELLVRITSSYDSNIFKSLLPVSHYIVAYDDQLQVYRPYDNLAGLWVVNSLGHFPYYRQSEVVSSAPGRWVNRRIADQSNFCDVVSYDFLVEAARLWSSVSPRIVDVGFSYELHYSDYYAEFVLCDDDGSPFTCFKESQTSVGQGYDYYDQSSNTEIHDNVVIDTFNEGDTNNFVLLDVDGAVLNIDSYLGIDKVIYDLGDKIYYVDSHDKYVYDQTSNSYVSNYYSNTVQYHLDYTAVTYIGYSEQYDKQYQFYYELPDGRSSADLTAEDLEQLSMVFADVIPYARTADNVAQRFLYHFDGDTLDSSYWSYRNEFLWLDGASLTYLDEGIFGGSLYLDELRHQFRLSLPGSDFNDDFTFQFRIYQSATLTPHLDSGVWFGGTQVLGFDGSVIYNGVDSDPLASMPVGSWVELCLMRSGSTLYYFLNGVQIDAVPWNTYADPFIRFDFQPAQRTTKRLDEMRFSVGAIYDPAGYTPSAVPFDSNLALVLPGSVGVADEVVTVVPADIIRSSNLFNLDLLSSPNPSFEVDGDQLRLFSNTAVTYSSVNMPFSVPPHTVVTLSADLTITSGDAYFYFKTRNNVVVAASGVIRNNGFHSLTFTTGDEPLYASFTSAGPSNSSSETIFSDIMLNIGSSALPYEPYFEPYSANYLATSGYSDFSIPVSVPFLSSYSSSVPVYLTDSYASLDGSVLSVTDPDGGLLIPFAWNRHALYDYGFYTVSVVLSDGTYSTFTFYFSSAVGGVLQEKLDVHGNLRMSVVLRRNGNDVLVLVQPYDLSSSIELLYLEVVSGEAPAFTIQRDHALYDAEDLGVKPVLAVRTNTVISGYQIGGVRPSYPRKGLVYGMVEQGRLRSLQQYNGIAWVDVDGRIWTGSRWIPYSSFDVFLLKDLYDISGAVTSEDYEYIYSDNGFYDWWQRSWLAFNRKLDQLFAGIGGGSSNEVNVDITNSYQTNFSEVKTTASDLTLLGRLVSALKSWFSTSYGVSDLFDQLGSDSVKHFFTQEAQSQLDTTIVVYAVDPADFDMHFYYDNAELLPEGEY